MIRIAAAGDLHFGRDSAGTLRPHLERLANQADVLLMTGDLTKWGDPEEGAVLARELAAVGVPTVTVLGNHDYQSNAQGEVRRALEGAGVTVLEIIQRSAQFLAKASDAVTAKVQVVIDFLTSGGATIGGTL